MENKTKHTCKQKNHTQDAKCFSLTELRIFNSVKNAVLYDPGYNSVIPYLDITEMLF